MASNQITVYLDPTQLPVRTMDQPTFDAAMAYLVSNFPTFGAQFNAGVANFNAAASGGAYAIPYTIDLSATADADPGAGKVRFDNATQNLAATLRLDLLGSNSIDYTSMLDTFDASTSTVKGQIRIVKLGDNTKQLMFDVTARTAPTGYRDISVTPRWSTSANPFVNGDAVLLFFTRTGDKGDQGPSGSNALTLLGSYTVSTAVANIDFLNLFTSAYDNYIIEVNGVTLSGADSLQLRLAKAGAADSASVYYGASTNNGASQTTANSSVNLSLSTGNQFVGSIDIRNANDAVRAKGVGYSMSAYDPGTSGWRPCVFESVYAPANIATGFRLYAGSGATFTAGTIRVFGIKNT